MQSKTRTIAATAALVSFLASPALPERQRAGDRSVGAGAARGPGPRAHPRVQSPPLRRAAPPGIPLRREKRALDPRAIPLVRPRGLDRDVLRAVPDSEGAPARDAGAGAFSRRARRAPGAGRSDLGADEPAAADLQRLLDRRRRDGAARVRQLRRPGRLRAPRVARRGRQGQDRHRALRRELARHQAEARRRARRRRLPHLLRSARRRLLPGGRLSEGAAAPRTGSPARQRQGHSGLLRRPADPRCRRHETARELRPEGRPVAHEDPDAADLLR